MAINKIHGAMSNMLFYCKNCKTIFEAKPEKVEYHSPIYGPCFKYVANCNICHEQCDEYRKPIYKTNIKKQEPCCPSCQCHR